LNQLEVFDWRKLGDLIVLEIDQHQRGTMLKSFQVGNALPFAHNLRNGFDVINQ
jgi:hypothetical protein